MEFVLEHLDKLDFSQPLSFRTIRDRTKIDDKRINKRLILGTLYNSGNYIKVKPLEVGCGKRKLNIWTRV